MLDRAVVLELRQFASGLAVFGGAAELEGPLISFPKAEWDSLGNPMTITISVFPGGEMPEPTNELARDALGGTLSLGAEGPYL